MKLFLFYLKAIELRIFLFQETFAYLPIRYAF